jgi:hypothetical protein
MLDLRRRQFITLLGGAAAAWPLAARAQQPERVRRIGVLAALAEDDPEMTARLAAFRQGLQKRGWSEGRNVSIDIRFAPAAGKMPLGPRVFGGFGGGAHIGAPRWRVADIPSLGGLGRSSRS